MAKVRARKESGNLYLDFTYKNVRCREQTDLKDTPENRKKAEDFLKKIEALILLDKFDYAEVFPTSKNLKKFITYDEVQKEVTQAGGIQGIGPKTNALNQSPTFKIFAEQWFKEKTIEWRASHLRNVRSNIERYFFPYFGKYHIGNIRREHIINFRLKLSEQPGRGGNVTISAKSVNNVMGILQMILSEAALRYGFENPYQHISPLKLKKTHVEPFSLIEVNSILDNVREDFRNYYCVRFFTGMRTGEIDGLKWEYVDFENRQILIRETIVNGRTEYTKTNSSQREIPMLGPVFEALKNQYKATSRISKYVFCNESGGALDHGNITKRVWYPLLEYLGLRKRRPYQTRHTAATLLLASGENPEWVARVLGHSSTEMLFKVYSRYIPNLTRNDGSAFDRLLQQQGE